MISCLLMGEESLLVQCAESLRARGHRVAAFVAHDPAVHRWAAPIGIPVIDPGVDLEAQVADVQYDWFFGIANLRAVPTSLWRGASRGAALFHDGPLPRYAGFNGPSWALLAGEARYGVTWHAAGDDDRGGIYVQRLFDVAPDDTAFTLNSKCYEAGIETFGELLDAIERGTMAGRLQVPTARLEHGRHDRPACAATLRFERPAAELDALVRALDFGPGYANPLALPKLRLAHGTYYVTALSILQNGTHTAPAGSVISVDDSGAVVAAADGPVKILRMVRDCGTEVQPGAVLRAAEQLPLLGEPECAQLTGLVGEVAAHESFFRERLSTQQALELPGVNPPPPGVEPDLRTLSCRLPEGLGGNARLAAVATYLSRASAQDSFDLPYVDDAIGALAAEAPGYFAPAVPLRVQAGGATTASLTACMGAEIAELRRRRGYAADLPLRLPGRPDVRHSVGLASAGKGTLSQAMAGCAVTLNVPTEGDALSVIYDRTRLSDDSAQALVRRLRIALDAFATNPSGDVSALELLSDEERARLLVDWNRSAVAYDRDACVHRLFERQVDATPDAVALVCEDELLTYRELDARANRVANALLALGVAPDAPVGLFVHRSLDLVVAALGIQKAGGAYLPLDPSYPSERLSWMIQDSGTQVMVTQRTLLESIPVRPANVLCVEDDAVASAADGRPQVPVQSRNLAYVIYTSGSTGQPKGVMVEHRNVSNFFAGMDDRVAREAQPQPVWLAVTSLSFDISVLELFWTLARGFKVVIGSDEDRTIARPGAHASRPMDFGLFYWGNDDAPGPRKYRLLLEGARFADSRGFHSIWTPERHFHAFGGPYPNPAVTGAAVAAVTRNLQVRAGSCVLPLHHPARVAEEWSVIDNLSNGRVGLSFASGWMPEDFLLRPENAPPHNNASMIRDIDVVRRLWRGEAVPFESPTGAPIAIVTQPRPVQKELPIWVTTAGNPETYRKAAEIGANVLTHLLGQSIAEVADKIRLYRAALAEHGRDPAQYQVTLMLHTLVGQDREQVRELARGPMIAYLRSAAALIRQYAWAFPAFKKPPGVAKPMDIDLRGLPADEMDAILEFAFRRYFDDSGLFGTVDDAIARVQQLKSIGVDEIACLIDFGIDTDVALSGLEPLAEVVRRTSRPAPQCVEHDYSIAAQIARHGATHLQCTPSMVRMLTMNDEARAALGRVRHFFVGGEALPGTLVAELRSINATATVENMYGPTETTIWSATQTAAPCEGVVPLGRPIANTQLYVLDTQQRLVPPGTPGELCIGGDGVARGYLHRDDLTLERFLPDPFRKGGRLYRTGDLARYTEDGVLHFLGRLDHQVKVRGYRIELGEIEARLAAHPGVREAVVVAREDAPGDVRLVAYLRFASVPLADDALRAHLQAALPEYMVPSHYVAMASFPLTPNAKVDRKALPRPDMPRTSAAEYVAPENDLQRQIAEVYRRVLGVPRIGLDDNFFRLGGHSLLAVQAHRELRAGAAPGLSITDVFRFPTVAALAAHLEGGGKPGERLERVADRAAARREALTQRRGQRRVRQDK